MDSEPRRDVSRQRQAIEGREQGVDVVNFLFDGAGIPRHIPRLEFLARTSVSRHLTPCFIFVLCGVQLTQ